ncbi:MAG: protein translocase subunit SecD [Henriciella sp.]|nr:protein translocase subunit SecD [Henriciella sp.]MBO6696643.1 protein translocase subunit SecD [Henriciella sp.]
MLNFPLWKVGIIVVVLLWGTVLALPNMFSDGFLGVQPKEVSDPTNTAAVAAYEQQLQEADQSWWFLPSGKLNLGLDLQGGVYLLMEIDPAEIAANRLETVQADIRSAFNRNPLIERNPPVQNEDRLTIEILNPEEDMDEAVRRLNRLNPTIGTTQTELFDVQQTGDRFIQLTVTGNARTALASDAQSKMMEIIRRRIDPDGVAEISITPQGDNRIILEAPGEADPKRIKDILGQAGRLTFNMANLDSSAIQAAINSGRTLPRQQLVDSVDYGQILINRIPELTGADIATANRCFDEANFPAVCFRLNSSAATKFYNLTRNNTGKNFAIVLDGTSMSSPTIRTPIPGGNVIIEGRFTIEEAEDLAAIIEAGELPAKLNFLDERTVGPTLGAESIAAGSRASLIGLAFVGLFMVLAYGLIGGFAVGSLLSNIVLIIGALSGFGATLTLPGIAGIILTIGMAVDANVIVFERIREEQASGRSPATAIQAGYERALSAILDANITTFIAASILYMVGSGPVKGFAVTLAIGILTSVFTAFVVTRWLTVMYLRTMRPKRLSM